MDIYIFDNVPIWKDTYYTYQTSGNKYVDYYITNGYDEIIYSGRAYTLENNNKVDINMSDICSEHLSSSILYNSELKHNLFMDYDYDGLFKLNILDNDNNVVVQVQYYFYNDWSYRTFDNIATDMVCLNEPINTSLPPGAYLPVSFFRGSTLSGTKTIRLIEKY